jgi:hypothetical protein
MTSKRARYEVETSTGEGWFFLELKSFSGNWGAKFPEKRPRSDINDRLLAQSAARDRGAPEKCPCYLHWQTACSRTLWEWLRERVRDSQHFRTADRPALRVFVSRRRRRNLINSQPSAGRRPGEDSLWSMLRISSSRREHYSFTTSICLSMTCPVKRSIAT